MPHWLSRVSFSCAQCALFFLVRGHAEIIRKFHFDSDRCVRVFNVLAWSNSTENAAPFCASRRQQPPRSDLGLEFVFEGEPACLAWDSWFPAPLLTKVLTWLAVGIPSAFHEQFWYWDLLDTAHKLFMTSCLVFIPTTFQLPAAMAATWLSMRSLRLSLVLGPGSPACLSCPTCSLVLWMNPYVRSVDDRMHTFASAELITLLLGAHVINHQRSVALYLLLPLALPLPR